jgi:hypothetical protein
MTVSINRDNYLTKDEIKTYLMDGYRSAPRDPHGDEIYWRRLEYTASKPKKKLEDIPENQLLTCAYPLAYGIKLLLK